MSETETTNGDETRAGGSFLARIMIGMFVVLVILGECLLAYMIIPSAEDVADKAKEIIAEDQPQDSEADVVEEDDEAMEVELGDFSLTLHQPTASSTMHIQFLLVGTVSSDNKAEFDGLLENNKHRFRDKVLSEIRESEVTDLTEPGLGLIKRRILAKSNALFGKPLLTSIIFSKFTFHEQ